MRIRSSASIALLVVACGAGQLQGGGASRAYSGRVTYDSRQPTAQGASEALTVRPARFCDLEVRDENGAVLVEGRTDEEGRFSIEAPASAKTLYVLARVRAHGHDASIVSDANGRETHRIEVELGDPSAPLAIHAIDATGDAGAFHVVDTLLRGLDAVRQWTGRTLPPVYAYWVRGGTREWSYYRGERPVGSGRFALELLGGDPGQQSISDTDEHDEAIILHELGHFVMDRLSTDSSSGGSHPRGVRIDPGLAWEEGRATWFALAVLRDPMYRDTIGIEPWGRLRLDEDVERGTDAHPGLASETSVSKILWDLSDGAEGLPDADNDGIALGPVPVLSAMMELTGLEGGFPSLGTFLRHLPQRGVIADDALRTMLERTGEPADLLASEVTWPRTIGVGESVSAKIDGLTQPAPSGGPNFPASGFDAVHSYRLRVTEAGMLVVRLEIVGSGTPNDRQDLDLELLDMRAERLADSRGEEARESVTRFVTPGFYIVRVRDGGNGNRADYRLRADIETLGGSAADARP